MDELTLARVDERTVEIENYLRSVAGVKEIIHFTATNFFLEYAITIDNTTTVNYLKQGFNNFVLYIDNPGEGCVCLLHLYLSLGRIEQSVWYTPFLRIEGTNGYVETCESAVRIQTNMDYNVAAQFVVNHSDFPFVNGELRQLHLLVGVMYISGTRPSSAQLLEHGLTAPVIQITSQTQSRLILPIK